MRELVPFRPQSPRRETNASAQLTFSVLFTVLSRTPAHCRVPPTFRVDPPCSVKPFWKHLRRHAQRYVSVVILIMGINHQYHLVSSPVW